jgi:hypothetical protein
MFLIGIVSLALMFVVKMDHKKKPTDNRYRERSTVAGMEWFASGIRVYFYLNNSVPSIYGKLNENLEAGGVYFGKCPRKEFCFKPVDAWGGNLKYTVNGQTAIVYSAGIDQRFETRDDLVCDVVVHNGTNVVWGLHEIGILRSSERSAK